MENKNKIEASIQELWDNVKGSKPWVQYLFFPSNIIEEIILRHLGTYVLG